LIIGRTIIEISQVINAGISCIKMTPAIVVLAKAITDTSLSNAGF
jgi:hypothetical protein